MHGAAAAPLVANPRLCPDYAHGIKIFWLDASEPEISTADAQHAADFYSNSVGTGQQVGMMFPFWHTQMIHDGLVSEGETEVVMLTRSAWAGMQRWGAALWSGDTSSHVRRGARHPPQLSPETPLPPSI